MDLCNFNLYPSMKSAIPESFMKYSGITMSEGDRQKLDVVCRAEQVQSRSEMIRRLIDSRFREIRRNAKARK